MHLSLVLLVIFAWLPRPPLWPALLGLSDFLKGSISAAHARLGTSALNTEPFSRRLALLVSSAKGTTLSPLLALLEHSVR